MKTKIQTKKTTVMKWIERKFGSLKMLAEAGGLDTSTQGVQALLNDIVHSRDPIDVRIGWRSHVFCIAIMHHKALRATTITGAEDAKNYVSEIPTTELVDE